MIDGRAVGDGTPLSVRPVTVALVGLVLVAAFVIRNLIAFGGDPAVFLAVGEDAGAARDYAVSRLGDGIHLVPGVGHDGRFFFAQANDPLLRDPETHAVVLDRPLYRSQRMLFPLFAGLAGLLPPVGVMWGILALSVLTFAVGTFATSLVAQTMGGSPWWGLAFPLNIGVISELLAGGSGHLGLALVLLSVAALQRGRTGASLVALAGAALTREVMLVAAAGITVWLWQRGHRRQAGLHLVVPGLMVGLWALYVRVRLGWAIGVGEVEELGWPLRGLVDAAVLWPGDLQNLLVGVLVVVIMILFVVRFVNSGWLVGYAAVGFVPIALLLSRQVWFSYYDITRAVSPVITAYLLMAFAARGRNDEAILLEVRR